MNTLELKESDYEVLHKAILKYGADMQQTNDDKSLAWTIKEWLNALDAVARTFVVTQGGEDRIRIIYSDRRPKSRDKRIKALKKELCRYGASGQTMDYPDGSVGFINYSTKSVKLSRWRPYDEEKNFSYQALDAAYLVLAREEVSA